MKEYGLIGKSLKHSFSEKYFNRKFEEDKTEAVYRNIEIESADLLRNIIEKNTMLQGLNVTIPFKEEVIPFLDELSDDAKAIQAVNTLKIERHPYLKLTGFNTDHIGFRQSLNPLLQNKSRINALVLGSGGAAKAVKYSLHLLGIEFVVVSRAPEGNQIHYSEIDQEIIESHKLIINTTPLGMYPDKESYPDLPYDFLNEGHICYDLIYNPQKTVFLEKAEKQGSKIKNGYEMLVLQAEASWKIWNKLKSIPSE